MIVASPISLPNLTPRFPFYTCSRSSSQSPSILASCSSPIPLNLPLTLPLTLTLTLLLPMLYPFHPPSLAFLFLDLSIVPALDSPLSTRISIVTTKEKCCYKYQLPYSITYYPYFQLFRFILKKLNQKQPGSSFDRRTPVRWLEFPVYTGSS